MQITHAEVTPVQLKLRNPVQVGNQVKINQITAIFVRLETNTGRNAWGCGVVHPDLTGETVEDALHTCGECAAKAPDLHPTNIEYSLAELAPLTDSSPAALCAFDLAFHDLLGLAADMPLYRLLGGYRNRIQTSVTIPIMPEKESVEMAAGLAKQGFRIIKVKGGNNPEADVQIIHAIRRALPYHTLRLDPDGGYTVPQALDVARALKNEIEMLEQPTSFEDLEALQQVTRNSPVPVLADQSVVGPASALELASHRIVSGLSIKAATCGGIHCCRQIDAIARAARITTMVGCVIEPALLISAGLALALSSPNVQYGDLDGNLSLLHDPTTPGFRLEEGWLVASEIPGLGCTVQLR